jgi:hypothetical protein
MSHITCLEVYQRQIRGELESRERQLALRQSAASKTAVMRKALAVHEAGHAMVAMLLGQPIEYAVVGNDSTFGEVRYVRPVSVETADEAFLQAVVTVAGDEAVRLLGLDSPGGAQFSNDSPRSDEVQILGLAAAFAGDEPLAWWEKSKRVARHLLLSHVSQLGALARQLRDFGVAVPGEGACVIPGSSTNGPKVQPRPAQGAPPVRWAMLRAMPDGVTVTADGRIENASLLTIGPAVGHGFEIDGVTLQQVRDLINREPWGVRVRFKHPEITLEGAIADDLGTVIGSVLPNTRILGSSLRGDIKLDSYAAHVPGHGNVRARVLMRAKTEPSAVGMSLVFAWAPDPRIPSRAVARVSSVLACDFVDTPAANPNGLLAAA